MNLAGNTTLRLWIGPGAVWVALLLLLAATVGVAYLPLGIFNTIISLIIAAVKVTLVMVFFMELQSSSALIRLAALAGMFWLILLFSLTAGDYLTRQ